MRRPSSDLLVDLVEAGLEHLRVLLDLVVVDRHEFDLAERRVARRRLDVGPAGVNSLAGQELLRTVSLIMNSASAFAAFGWGAPLMTTVGAPMANAPSAGQMVLVVLAAMLTS